MNAKELIEQLAHLSKSSGVALENIDVYYRFDFDSDIEDVNFLFEDLYDQETNSLLQTIVLTTKSE